MARTPPQTPAGVTDSGPPNSANSEQTCKELEPGNLGDGGSRRRLRAAPRRSERICVVTFGPPFFSDPLRNLRILRGVAHGMGRRGV